MADRVQHLLRGACGVVVGDAEIRGPGRAGARCSGSVAGARSAAGSAVERQPERPPGGGADSVGLGAHQHRLFHLPVVAAGVVCAGDVTVAGSADGEYIYGRYPPLFYVAAGVPSLWASGGRVLWWMRLGGDVVNAVLLTATFLIVGRSANSVWALVGVAAAATPMVLFLGSVVNPSGLEICSAVTLWSALLALTRSPGGQRSPAVAVWAAASAVVSEMTRGLSPVLMVLTVAAACVAAPPGRVRQLFGRRQVRIGAAVVVAFGALAAAWIVGAGTLRLMRVSTVPASVTTAHLVRLVLGDNTQFDEFVGRFG